jgi:histone H3/H4
MQISVEIKQVYGKEVIYPICDRAKAFARLVKQKTLTREDIACIREIGFIIAVVQPELKL